MAIEFYFSTREFLIANLTILSSSVDIEVSYKRLWNLVGEVVRLGLVLESKKSALREGAPHLLVRGF